MTGAICGGLLLRPNDRTRARWVRALAVDNPAYLAWLRHGKGQQPPRQVHPVGTQDGGPWRGGAVVPRYAPGMDEADAVDRTTCPTAEALTLRGELRPYQQQAVEQAVEAGRGVVVAPTGAGKTVIGCGLIAAHDTPALILVHARVLADQWVERIETFLGVEADVVGYGRKLPATVGRVTVASLQTLARWSWHELHEWGAAFGLVIQDEAHHAPARTFCGVLGGLRGRHRYGLTATPSREDGLTPWMHATLGPTVAQVDHVALERAGRVLRPTIRTWHAPEVDLDGMEPHERAEALALCVPRNLGLTTEARLLVARGHVVLALVQLVEHAHSLAEIMAEHGLKSAPLVGDMKPLERAAVLDHMRAGRLDVVVATSLADEGLDAPRVSAVMLTAPTRNIGRTLQRIGRALRPHEGAPNPVVVDVVDTWGPFRGYAQARRTAYVRHGWIS
ncbi:MAG: helicase [Arenimonas sp.]|nr:helicase [Arenimonas sp.]